MKPLLLLLLACTSPQPSEVAATSPTVTAIDVPVLEASEHHIGFHLQFPQRAGQYLQVTTVVPTQGRETVELAMATWTPGSYLIRDYSRHVERMTAQNDAGAPLNIRKTKKNRWVIETKSSTSVQVTYHLYADQLNVRGNWVEETFAVLNGAPTFLYDPQNLDLPFHISLDLPDGWPDVHTALPQTGTVYIAEDLDTLIDTPWLMGTTTAYTFDVEGIAHTFVNWGEQGVWDGAQSAEDVETIVREHIQFWGATPYPHYIFLNVLSGSRGGLEHKNSTLMMSDKWNTHDREAYLDWLGLVSHEFFHTWNVKRLRPKPLGPFNYESENYTKSLWISEGITSYYDDLLLVRAGLMSEDEYLKRLSKQLERFQNKPGRTIRSLEDVSFDAWIKHYKKDANSLNTAVSYYSKGAVVGWLLDIEIRRATSGTRSLDDVLHAALLQYSGTDGFTPEQFQRIAENVAETSLEPFWDAYVRGTDELSYDTALQWLGLTMAAPGDALPWLGISLDSTRGKTVIRNIHRDSPAFNSSLIVGDELIALDEFRIQGNSLDSRLEQLNDRTEFTVLASRRGMIFETVIRPDQRSAPKWVLQPAPRPTKLQQNNRRHWLSGTRP